MRPTVLLLVRHGVTATTGKILPGRAAGLHLSDEGRAQAEAAARRIQPLPRVAAIYSSPLERARETALPIARARKMPVRIDRGLLECDFGEWTGQRLDRLSKRPEWEIVQRHPSAFRFPGGESFIELQARITGALARLVAQHPGRVVVAVSHADPIKAAVAHALGMPLDLFQRLVIGTASITAIAYGRTNAAILTVNSVDGELAAVLG
jgi:probable phosphoglycerate mutase